VKTDVFTGNFIDQTFHVVLL